MHWLLLLALADARLVAVLEFKDKVKQPGVDAGYLADAVRTAALDAGVKVMTRENMLVLLKSSGKKLEDCEGECEVDTGRRLGADLVVSGEVLKFGSRYKLDLRMHETQNGTLVSGAQASGKSPDDLDDAIPPAVKKLFASLASAPTESPRVAAQPAPAPAPPAAPVAKASCSSPSDCNEKCWAGYEPAKHLAACQEACAGGFGETCGGLGQMYEKGESGLPKDAELAGRYYAAAVRIYEKECTLADDKCGGLAFFYFSGRGVARDVARGMALDEKACSARSVFSCKNLGYRYEHGEDAPLNRDEARSYYRRACELVGGPEKSGHGFGDPCDLLNELR